MTPVMVLAIVRRLCAGSTSTVVQTEAGMKNIVIRRSLSLPSAVYGEIVALSRERGITPNAVIRDAVAQYLTRSVSPSADPGRMATLAEFTQAAVDILIRQQAPDKREEIILTVEQRMERFHGQK